MSKSILFALSCGLAAYFLTACGQTGSPDKSFVGLWDSIDTVGTLNFRSDGTCEFIDEPSDGHYSVKASNKVEARLNAPGSTQTNILEFEFRDNRLSCALANGERLVFRMRPVIAGSTNWATKPIEGKMEAVLVPDDSGDPLSFSGSEIHLTTPDGTVYLVRRLPGCIHYNYKGESEMAGHSQSVVLSLGAKYRCHGFIRSVEELEADYQSVGMKFAAPPTGTLIFDAIEMRVLDGPMLLDR